MNIDSLLENIANELDLHNSKKKTFCWMIKSMISQHNVQHHSLIQDFKNEGTEKFKLERVRRFFANTEIDPCLFAKNLVSVIWKQTPKMHLILDRTNWKFGKQDINYLVLAVRIDNIVFPLFWTMIDHQGNSEQQSRIELLNQFKGVANEKGGEYKKPGPRVSTKIEKEIVDFGDTFSIHFVADSEKLTSLL